MRPPALPKLRDCSTVATRISDKNRGRGPTVRYYADVRDSQVVGGRQAALAPAGTRDATSCPAKATALAEAPLAELEELRSKLPNRVSSPRAFGPFACRHSELTAVNKRPRRGGSKPRRGTLRSSATDAIWQR
jgi:hypothetical protein